MKQLLVRLITKHRLATLSVTALIIIVFTVSAYNFARIVSAENFKHEIPEVKLKEDILTETQEASPSSTPKTATPTPITTQPPSSSPTQTPSPSPTEVRTPKIEIDKDTEDTHEDDKRE